MAKPRKWLAKPRYRAFTHQAGRCFYCSQPMWLKNLLEFASKYKITIGQARSFQCTGEHLKAHQDGGTTAQTNIVAACWFCNQKRHQRKEVPHPDQYKKFIHQRMSQGRWHNVRLNWILVVMLRKKPQNHLPWVLLNKRHWSLIKFFWMAYPVIHLACFWHPKSSPFWPWNF